MAGRSIVSRNAVRRTDGSSGSPTPPCAVCGHAIESGSVPLPQEPTLNFGNGLSAFDDPGSGKTTVIAAPKLVLVSDNYVIQDEDGTILVDASAKAISIVLPDPARFRVYTVKSRNNGAAFDVTVTASGGRLIDGQASVVLPAGSWTRVQADDTDNIYIVIG